MKIFFIRHGQDSEDYRGGWSQRGLIDIGFKQSELLGKYIAEHYNHFNLSHIISSDLQRAVDTAQTIENILKQNELHIPIQFSDHWRETNNGVIAGMHNDEVDEKYPGLYFNSLDMDEPYPGGESPRQFYNRIKEAFLELCHKMEQEPQEANLMIVTHGGVISIIKSVINGIEWHNKLRFKHAPTASITTVEHITNKGWIMEDEHITVLGSGAMN